jgi:Type II CAAX prenyl endopeptidase Rce1-like
VSKIHYIWCLLFAGLFGCIIYGQQCNKVFPSASIDLKLTKAEIESAADVWQKHSGYKKSVDTNGIKSTTFSFDDDTKTFLEYELGSSKANELMSSTIPTWYWSTRYCKPLKQEEFTCWINPTGQLVSYEHSLENDAAKPVVTHEKAQEMAETALKTEAKVDMTNYKLIEDGSIDQAHRTDHYFTWENKGQNYNGAKLRTYAYVAGNEVTAVNHYLKIPDTWKRKFSKLRSYNDALEGVATIFYEALNAGVFFVFLWSFANGQIKWRFTLTIAIIYAVFAILEAINGLPSSLHEYTTTTPFRGFELEFALQALWSGVSTFFQIFTLVAAAETIYRLAKPKEIALQAVLTVKGLKTRPVMQSMLAGVGTFGIHLGWLILYYILGRSFKLWCPLEVANSETLSSLVPAFSALNVGFTASLTEEFTYRVLGLMAFQRIVKKFWLANLLQAAAWAFMHSNYPQEPPYARGLELTVVGVLYGAVMSKFGLVACVLSHNLVDTFLGLAPLFDSTDKGLQASAFIAMLPLVVVVLLPIYLRFKTKRFTSGDTITNQALTPERPHSLADDVQHTAHSYAYKKLTAPKRIFLVILLVVAGSIEFGLHLPTLGHQLQVTFSREQAIKAARKVLIDRDLRPDNFSEVAWIAPALDLEEFQYAFEKARDRMNSLVFNPETPVLWIVRFYKPLSGDEYRVTFNANGKLQAVDVVMEEDEPGANLTKEQALAKVEEYFRKLHPEMLPYIVDDSRQQKREARTDWTFTFKLPRFKVGDADYKVTINCIGDQPSDFSNGWKLPDAWKFHRAIKNTRERVVPYVLYACELGLIVLVLLWARGVIRAAAIPWRPAIMVGAAMTALVLIRNLNDWPLFFSSYAADAPLDTFFVQKIASYFLQAISSFSMSTVIAAFGLGSLRLLIPPHVTAAILRTSITPARGKEMSTNRQIWLDAALIGLAIGTLWQSLNVLTAFARNSFSPELASAPMEMTCHLVNFMDPAIEILISSLHEGFQFPFAVAIVMGLYAKYLRNFRNYLIITLIFSLAYPVGDKYWQNYLIDASWNFSSCMVLYILIAKFARENFLAYFLTAAVGSMVSFLRVLVAHGQVQYQQDIITTTVTIILPLIYVLYASLNTGTREAEPLVPPDSVANELAEPLPSVQNESAQTQTDTKDTET